MSVINTVKHFSSYTGVPIDPDEVKDHIISYGMLDEINFVFVEVNPSILIGQIHSYTRVPGLYAESLVCTDIYVNENAPKLWQRFATCKELLHLFDHSKSQTKSQQQLSDLITDMTKKPNESLLDHCRPQARADYLMIYYALSIMLPYETREALMPAYKAQVLTPARVSELLQIPEAMVELAMADTWEGTYDLLVGSR